jgi:hypothetical protein
MPSIEHVASTIFPPILADIAAGPAGDVGSNPLAILTFIAAPAVLTNAASLLALGTSNRFGRNVDRSRAIIKILDGLVGDSVAIERERAMYRRLLGWLERRMQMLMSAMSLFYLAIGCFAAGSLASLVGALLVPTDHPYALRVILGVALITGVGGLGSLVSGGVQLVRETRLALVTIREEMAFFRVRYGG